MILLPAGRGLGRACDRSTAGNVGLVADRSGVLVGVAFNTKMLAAFIPGAGVRAGRRRRLPVPVARAHRRLAVFGLTTLVVSASWLVVVDLDAGVGPPLRRRQHRQHRVGPHRRVQRPRSGRRQRPGRWRRRQRPRRPRRRVRRRARLGPAVQRRRRRARSPGCCPLAVLGALVALWTWRRDSRRLGAVLLWIGWFALYAVVFSLAKGTFHSYYTSVMAPAVGAMIGIGGVALVAQARKHVAWLAVAGVGDRSAPPRCSSSLIGRTPDFQGWTRPRARRCSSLAGMVGLVMAAHASASGPGCSAALAIALVGLLVTPAAWAANETTAASLNATLPQAGPREGTAGRTFGSTRLRRQRRRPGRRSCAAPTPTARRGTWSRSARCRRPT